MLLLRLSDSHGVVGAPTHECKRSVEVLSELRVLVLFSMLSF